MKELKIEIPNNHRQRSLALRSWALSLLLLLPGRGFALDPSRSIVQYNCRSWTRQQGLPANSVRAITQTKDGYVCLGTSVGLMRFDGVDFRLLDLKQVPEIRGTAIRSLAVSQSGGLWIGLTHGSFAYCNGNEITLRGREEWGGTSLNVFAITEATNGDLWIAGQGQASRLTKAGAFENILPEAASSNYYEVHTAFEDSRGRIWLGTSGRGLFYWQRGVLHKLPFAALDRMIIWSVAEDKQGRIWFGTDSGLYVLDSDQTKAPILISAHEAHVVFIDRRGAVWAGADGEGLLRYWNGALAWLRKVDGLSDNAVRSLAEDREGNLWVGTRHGLNELSDIKIPTFGLGEGWPGELKTSVCVARDGGLWVTTSSGFLHSDGRTNVSWYSADVGLSNSYVTRALEGRDGNVYLATGARDIEVFAGGKIVARYPNKEWPSALGEDAEGVVAAVGGELYQVGTNFYRPYPYRAGGKLPMSYVYNMICGSDGALWVGCPGALFEVKNGAATRWPIENGFYDTGVLSVFQDGDGAIWAGMTTGIARLKDGLFRYISRKNGLFDDMIYSMAPDDEGYFWMDSESGIFRVSRQSLNDFADGKSIEVECAGYTNLNVIKSAEGDRYPYGCKTPDGRIWFPTVLGVAMIDPLHLPSNPVAPVVHIDLARADERELDRAGDTVVRPGKGELEFHYAGLSYIAPLKIRYRYKLEGYDKDWVEAGNRRTAFYTNLKPGPYHFMVQACNEDGVWNTAGDDIALQLLPHFRQTAWFFALMALLAGLSLSGAYLWRVARLHRREEKLQAAHDLLEAKVAERTVQLQSEIEERKRMELQVKASHMELLEISRQAGMAEVATGVLHNVGNVLNSVNVAASVVTDRVKQSRTSSVGRVAAMLQEHAGNLAEFITHDPKGQRLPAFLSQLAEHLASERTIILEELARLRKNVEHINDIVAMQQTYANVSGVIEKVQIADLIEDALHMNESSLLRHEIKVVRQYDKTSSEINVDRHKIIQILVNLISNAKHACQEASVPDKQITIRATNGGDSIRVSVGDNGVGIAPENLTRVFSHGFTTKKTGHGFGLHSGAIAAKEMGGTLTVQSDGPGRGAVFTLELPVRR